MIVQKRAFYFYKRRVSLYIDLWGKKFEIKALSAQPLMQYEVFNKTQQKNFSKEEGVMVG